MKPPISISRKLALEAGALTFSPPVTHVYNPLIYAREPHERYLERYARPGIEVLLVGMNPGPFGMAQTGVPFGEVALVREWLGIEGEVLKPEREHPARPVTGFACKRSEVSGRRLWSWAAARFGTAEAFFADWFVLNYCPLAFLEESGRNYTPDKLPAALLHTVYAACDRHLAAALTALAPTWASPAGAIRTGTISRSNGMAICKFPRRERGSCCAALMAAGCGSI